MAAAGWYPDPSGQPGAFRYWDGTVWSETLADTPYGPAPGGSTPPQSPPPQSPPPPGYESYAAIGPLRSPAPSGRDGGVPPPPSGPSNGAGHPLGLVLIAAVLAVALGVGTFFVVRGLVDDSDPASAGSATDAPSTQPPGVDEPSDDPSPNAPSPPAPTDPPTDPAVPVEPTVQQCTGGLPERGVTGRQGQLMTGGGLQLPSPEGFEPTLDQALAFTFADGIYAPSKVVEQTETAGWVAVYALGSLSRGNGFDSPRQSAETVVACMSQSSVFYSNLVGSTQVASEEIVVDASPAWVLTQEIRIDNPELSVEGDVAKVVVVDTGDPTTYALFVSVVPIGDGALIAEQDAAVGELQVR